MWAQKPTPEHTWLAEIGYCVNATAPDFEKHGIRPEQTAIGAEYAWNEDAAYARIPNLAFIYAYEPAQGGTDWLCVSPPTIATASSYWAAMTITSIGYGDIVATRGNPGEQAIVATIMLCAGFVWAQVVATFCSLISSMSSGRLAYRELLTHLNTFMEVEKLPRALQYRLREYFFKSARRAAPMIYPYTPRSVTPTRPPPPHTATSIPLFPTRPLSRRRWPDARSSVWCSQAPSVRGEQHEALQNDGPPSAGRSPMGHAQALAPQGALPQYRWPRARVHRLDLHVAHARHLCARRPHLYKSRFYGVGGYSRPRV